MTDNILKNMNKNDDLLSQYACKNSEAIRFKKMTDDIRPSFFRDADKILYSLAYKRYIDKTQVFSNSDNDMISKRIIHVQFVSKIARTIGRALNLNEDLIEAASLGHDLGHTPFGHVGEKFLNDLSLKNGEGYFNHNVQSVRYIMDLENNGNGLNVSLQVLDAIFCHNGEHIDLQYKPINKSKEEFLYEYEQSYTNSEILKNVKPMTLEGCVVRISDVIAYIGQDIEDAIRIGRLKRDDIPNEIVDVLGNNNSQIVNTIILDIIENSYNKNCICMSSKIFNSLNELIKFNYKNIYLKANSDEELKLLENKFDYLFNLYIRQLSNNSKNEDIFTAFLNDMSNEYLKNTSNARKVIDYISGMTDEYFLNQYKKYVK